MRVKQFLFYHFFCAILVLFMTTSAFAHKPIVNAWTEGSEVMVEGAFSDGSAAKEATITVYDPDGAVLMEGKTDTAGVFSFPVVKKVDMRIEMNAGMGHVAETDVPVEDITFLAGDKAGADDQKDLQAAPAAVVASGPQLSKQDIQLIIDKSLKKQMRPIFEQLEARKFTDILSGIGYIIGLVGLAAYVNSRKKK